MMELAQSVFETVRCPLVLLDADFRVRQVNAAFLRTFEHGAQEVKGRCLFTIHEGQWDSAALRRRLERVIDAGSVITDFLVADDFPAIGRRVLLNASGLEHDGEPSVLVALEVDSNHETALTTEWEPAADRRAEIDRQFQLHIERMPLAYLRTAPDGRCTHWNRAAERLFGYQAAEVVGTNPFELLVPTHARAVSAAVAAEPKGQDLHGRAVWDSIAKDGRTVACRWHNTLLVDGGACAGVLSLVEDLTEKKNLEERYQHAQKMEAMGRLAGGVAHDFNNLLTVISGYSELLLERMPENDAGRSLAQEIFAAAGRSAALTRQLLAFSRKQVVLPEPLDLNRVVAGVERLLSRIIGEDVALHLVLAPRLGTVCADPGQIEQVLLNLAVNARDAMPQGGALTLETSDVTLDESYAQVYPDFTPGRFVRLAVSDTGCGMPPEVKARVFEPFFTTKPAGQGTGLGLAVVHGIVRQAGGYIDVYSEPGFGTTFKVLLPEFNQLPIPEPAMPRPPAPTRGSETILLAEDDAQVRRLACEVLTGCGYSVIEAADGHEALQLAERQREPLHLLLSDVVMPGLSGRQLAERVLHLHPEARILHLSGYTDDAVVRHGILHNEVHFLQKPFSPVALAHKVRAVLDGE